MLLQIRMWFVSRIRYMHLMFSCSVKLYLCFHGKNFKVCIMILWCYSICLCFVKLYSDFLSTIDTLHILNRDNSLYTVWSKLIDTLLEQFWAAFSIFVEFDDNKEFFSILKENRMEFLKKLWKKSELEKENSFSIEDFLRLRWVLKHITYYNKRYLIPS